jgi:TPR repeat protein
MRRNEAIQWLKWMAHIFYETGTWTTVYLAAAAKWYKAAADQDDPKGLFNVGVMYYQGKSVSQNLRHALELFRKAEARGRPKVSQAFALVRKKL